MSNVEIYYRYVNNILNAGNVEMLNEIFAFRYLEHQKGVYPPTIEGLERWISDLHSSFKDLHATVYEVQDSKGILFVRGLLEGTNVKAYSGIEPAGKHFVLDTIDEYRFHDSKIVEHWGVFDRFTLLQQIKMNYV
jgi:predicted ester cyclase